MESFPNAVSLHYSMFQLSGTLINYAQKKTTAKIRINQKKSMEKSAQSSGLMAMIESVTK